MNFSSRRAAGAFGFLVSLIAVTTPAMAEPPMMKEQSVRPRIEARSKDERFSVALGGFLQGRYTLVLRDIEIEASRFDTPRTRLYVFGHVYSPNVRYRLMLGTPASSVQPEGALRRIRGLRRGGHVAPSRGALQNPRVSRVGGVGAGCSRPWSARSSRKPSRRGAPMGSSRAGELFAAHVEYAVGVFNGAGRISEAGAVVRAPVVAGRAAWNLMGRGIEGEVDFEDSPRTVVVGISGYTTLDHDPSPTTAADSKWPTAATGST